MSELAKKARSAMRDKISRLMRTDPKSKVDGSSYVPPEPLDADVKTGLRPVSRRQFKKGGKVVMMDGKPVKFRADRKMRKKREDGGKTNVDWTNAAPSLKQKYMRVNAPFGDDENPRYNADAVQKAINASNRGDRKISKSEAQKIHRLLRGGYKSGGSPATPDNIINRDVKEANEKREGKKHIGGMKKGGAAKHEDIKMDKALIKKMVHKHEAAKHPGKPMTKLKHGGYAHKAAGGYQTGGTPPPAPPQMPEDVANDYNAWKISQEVKKEAAASKGPPTRNSPAKKNRGGALDGTLQGTRPTGGRLARKSGGRNNKKSGKMNVNIIIGTGRGDRAQIGAPPPMPGAMPVPVAPPRPPGGMPPGMGAAPPMPMPPPPMGGMPAPGGMPPMPRKTGGRTMRREGGRLQGVDKPGRVGHRTYHEASDMDAGAAGGLGKLEKVSIQRYQKGKR